MGGIVMSGLSMVRLLDLLPLAAAAVLPVSATAQDEPTGAAFFTNCLYGFAIIFPERPQQRDFLYASNSGKLQPAHQFFVEKGPNRYSLTVVDFFDGPKADVAIVEHASANLKQRGSLFHEDFATYDPGM